MSAEQPRVARAWPEHVFSPGRFGIVHPNLPWADVIKAYFWDNLRMAMELAENAGIGFNANYLSTNRMIEAEAVTRAEGEFRDYGDWLLLEHVPEFSGKTLEELEATVRRACDEVAQTFRYTHGPAILVTLLHPESNAPYVPGRHGFFVDKYPFDKVCLPTDLVNDPGEFHRAIKHEYAHAMVLNRTLGRCPTWLHEAVALLAERGDNMRVMRLSRWLAPQDLNRAFREDRESEQGEPVVRGAYGQAGLIGLFLVRQCGLDGISRLLDAFTDNTFLQNLMMQAKNERPEEEAVRQVLGFGVDKLFDQAHQMAVSMRAV